MNENIRSLFPLTKSVTYLNHAAVSPLPLPTIEAVTSQLKDVSATGSLHYRNWVGVRERVRTQLAETLGARPEQIAFMRNTSDGLSTIANGLGWRAGENVVTFRGEFPSNIYPWLRLQKAEGVEVRFCSEREGRVDVDELIALIDNQTRVVAISSVQYSSGYRSDIERIGSVARAKDALFVVDVIQSMGVLPIDVESQLIDAAAGACHKWLLAPEGIGLLYLSDRARERINPTLVGWMSVRNPEDYGNHEQPWARGTLPWETGTGTSSLIHGLDKSLTLLIETGVGRIATYLAGLTDYLCDGLRQRGYEVLSSRRDEEKSQIVSLSPKANWTPMSLYSHLKRNNIVTAPRGNGLRVSPHFYNNEADIDLLLGTLP